MKRLAILVPVVALMAGTALAQDYPSRAITIVVPQTAGGNTDTLARIFAPALSKVLGQEVIVENRPGAGNIVGTQFVADPSRTDTPSAWARIRPSPWRR